MSEEFLSCPRCACKKFYSHEGEGKMFFFQINTDFWPVATDVNGSDLSKADFSPVHCTACSWTGEIQDLQAKG